ncbi:MAG: amidohydrolase family protein [Verrucomicrobiota bacterium]
MKKQFSLTRAALSTGGCAESKFLSVSLLAWLILVLLPGLVVHAAGPPLLTSIVVIPTNVSLTVGQTRLFVAIGKDQYNNDYPISNALWTTSGGGTLAPGGISCAYLPTETGKHLIQCEEDGTSVKGAATITTRATKITAITLDPPTVSFQGHTTTVYSLQYCDNLRMAAWSNVPESNSKRGSNRPMSLSASNTPPAQARFFRLISCSDSSSSSKWTLFVNGTIYIDADRSVSNLLVRDGVVVGIDVNPDNYRHAELVDLNGAVAYPGFNDSHVHLISMAVAGSILVPTGGETNPTKIAAIVGARCQEVAKGTPVMAHGFVLQDYDKDWGIEDLESLDAATGPDCPVMIADQLGHSYIVNSAAMRLSKLDASTPDPPGGKIVKHNGQPTGMLRETAGAIVGNIAIFPRVQDIAVKPWATALMKKWASMGYTSIVELMGGPMGRTMRTELCRELEYEDSLALRIYYAYTFFSLDDIEGYRSAGMDTELVHFSGLKLFVDGAAGQGGAWTSWTNTQGNQGLNAVTTDDAYGEKYNIFRILEKSEELDLDMHYHVGGDKAIEAVLSAIEAVKATNGHLRGRHTLYHLGLITDDQIARMKELGSSVIAGVQPSLHWEFQRQQTEYYYGEHAKGSYPYKKMRDAGITLAFSTDFASNTEKLCWPTEIMRVALTGGGNPNNQPLTMRDMIEGFTVGGFGTTREADAGKLHIGYKADIVVYEKDLYLVPPEELSQDNPRVLSTWVGGRRITP